MKNLSKNQSGFSIVELIIILVIVALISAAGYFVYHKHHKSSTSAITITGSVTEQWKSYNSSGGHFSVSYPVNFTPITLPPTTKSQNGIKFKFSGFLGYKDPAGTKYEALYLTYPNNTDTPSLDVVLNEFLHSSQYQNSHLVAHKNTSISGYQAEDYDISASINGIDFYFPGVLVRNNNIIYQVLVQETGNTETANDQYFINSFKLN